MRCASCGRDWKYKERSSGRCPSCNQRFAFEPKNGDPVTDMTFKTAIERVSGNGKIRWGVDSLYYELVRIVRRRAPVSPGWLLLAVPLIVIGAGLIAKAVVDETMLWIVSFIFLVPALLLLIAVFRSKGKVMPRQQFDILFGRYVAAHGAPPGRISRLPQSRPHSQENDLRDYSFDRAVICDHADTVDLLLANNFHFENNCAVLSLDGYPQGPFESVRQMLRKNPQLQVIALHDATPEGCRLAHTLATSPEWFRGQARVVDVGLRPSLTQPFKDLWGPGSKGVLPGNGISKDEARWLSDHQLPLAVIRPEQILRRLYRALAKPAAGTTAKAVRQVLVELDADSDDDDSDVDTDYFDIDDDSFSADAGDTDGGDDGFG